MNDQNLNSHTLVKKNSFLHFNDHAKVVQTEKQSNHDSLAPITPIQSNTKK
jgi:hypothetical protein